MQAVRKNVLIIDDEPVMQEFVSRVVRSNGFDSTSLSDARLLSAQDILSFDMVILDLGMPELDGIEVIRILARNGCQSKLILISGMDRRVLDSAQLVASEQHLDVVGVLKKPFSVSSLRNMINAALSPRRHLSPPSAPKTIVTVDELRNAIARHELVLHLQPQILLSDMSWYGVEALTRWQHPVHGLLYPNDFIVTAENPEISLDFTYEVMRMAVEMIDQLSERTGFTGSFSINIPPSALTNLETPERAMKIFDRAGVKRSQIVLELTETGITMDRKVAMDILTRLLMKDFRLSIDDFGTGHSSLERLHKSQFHELKIDMLFVRELIASDSARYIVENSIALAQSLGMTAVAEGVEDAATMDALMALRCDIVQGYYISRPLPLEEAIRWACNLETASPPRHRFSLVPKLCA